MPALMAAASSCCEEYPMPELSAQTRDKLKKVSYFQP